MVIENSPSLDQCTSDCARKFTIHLRRNASFDPKCGIGFDWFRPQYEYPLTKIFVENNTIKPLFKGNIAELKKTYQFKNIKKISPFGTEYIPSVISMFSKNDTTVSKYLKNLQKNGLTLDIETYQIPGDDKPLDGFNAKCEFICSDANVKITPNSFDLSDLISSGYSKDILIDANKQLPRKDIKYYRKENAINIRIDGFLPQDTEIIVRAKFESGEVIEVGQVVLCENKTNRYITIQPVKFVMDGDYNLPYYQEDVESFFSQSLIKVKFKQDQIINLKNNSSLFSQKFLIKYNDEKMDIVKKFNNENLKLNYLLDMRQDIVELYNNLKNVNIDDEGHKITYLIFIDLYSQAYSLESEKKIKAKLTKLKLPIDPNKKYGAQYVGGVATNNKKNEWGNGAILYKPVIIDYNEYGRTLVHELSHSLGLDHIFEDVNTTIKFHSGYSDNIMDYTFTENELFEKSDNPFIQKKGLFKKNTISMNKFQWDIIKNDESVGF